MIIHQQQHEAPQPPRGAALTALLVLVPALLVLVSAVRPPSRPLRQRLLPRGLRPWLGGPPAPPPVATATATAALLLLLLLLLLLGGAARAAPLAGRRTALGSRTILAVLRRQCAADQHAVQLQQKARQARTLAPQRLAAASGLAAVLVAGRCCCWRPCCCRLACL